MTTEHVSAAGWRGKVLMTSDKRGILYDGKNTVVTLAPEVMLAALMGSTSINRAAFGYGNGRLVTPSTRSIPGVIQLVNPAQVTVGRDANNRKTVGTWRFNWTPTAPQTYDMLGLLASSGQLFAATNFTKVELQADETVAVAWTIYLRD